jgi:hypothetical protein
VERAHFGPNRAISAKLKKHMYLSKENHLWSKQEHVAHCLAVRTELVFERNASSNHSFYIGEKVIFLQIGLLS